MDTKMQNFNKKSRKNTLNKPLGRMIFIFMILCMGQIFAMLEVSNPVKIDEGSKYLFDGKEIDYNNIWNTYKPIEIKTNLGVPLLSSTKAELYLDKHDFSCGISCSSTIILKTYETGNLIDDIRFYTINGEKRIEQPIRSYKFYIKTSEKEIEVEDYSLICIPTGEKTINGTEIESCKRELIGTHIEKELLWTPYIIGTEVSAGVYEVKLEGQKRSDRIVDWQILTNNIWVEDWAVWNASYEVGLVAYYNFDETSGTTAIDSTGKNNLTHYGGVSVNQNGKNSKSVYYNGVSNYSSSNSNIGNGITGAGSWSISWWENITIKGGVETCVGTSGVAGNLAGWQLSTDTSMVVNRWGSNPSFVVTNTTGQWSHNVGMYNGTSFLFYKNGAFMGYSTHTQNIQANKFVVGRPCEYDGQYLTGYIDEVGVWNRTLSASEVSDLYNGGTGIFYGGSGVELNSPINNYVSPTNSVNFNCSATITGGAILTNISLWTNASGTWGITNTTALFFDLAKNNSVDTDKWTTTASGGSSSVTEDYNYQTVTATGTEHPSTMSASSTSIGLSLSKNNYIKVEIPTISASNSNSNNVQAWATVSIGATTIMTRTVGTSQPNADSRYTNAYLEIKRNSTADYYRVYNGTDLGVWTTVTFGELKFETFADSDGLSWGATGLIQFKNVVYSSGSSTNILTSTIDKPTLWSCQACDSDDDCGFATENRTVSIDTQFPTFVLNSLDSATTTLPANVTLSVTTSDSSLNTCWYNTTENATKTIYTCNTTIGIPFATIGAKTITVSANDTVNNMNYTSYNFNLNFINVTQSGNLIVGEGSTQTFTLLVNSTTSSIGDASANLWYGGVNKGISSKSVLDSNSIYFTSTFDLLNGTGNTTGKTNEWYWNYNTTSLSTRNTTTQNQTVYSVSLLDCGITTGRVILNLSLKDEELNSLVNKTSPEVAIIEIDMEVSSIGNTPQTWAFSKKWEGNNSVAVCVPYGLLNNTSYEIDFTIGYESSDHVREFYYMDNGVLDNTNNFNSYTDNTIDLMNLLTTDSTTFLFEYTDADNQEVDNIIVHTFRKYIGEGLFREVERSKQDDVGQTHMHLVEEDVIYYFMITQYGNILYNSDTYNAKCLSTPCQIVLSASATDVNWSIIDNEGGQYSISTDKSTRIVSTTFSINSIDLINASLYELENGELSLINQTSITATSGTLNLHVPLTYGNSTFFVAIYRDNTFVKSGWVDLTESGKDYFGTSGAIFGGLIILTLILMSVSEGAVLIVSIALSLIVILFMQLVELTWYSLVSIICVGGIILFKLVSRRNKQY